MQPSPTPEPILQVMSGFMAAQHLMVASEVGLFEQLGDDRLPRDELARRTGLPARSVRVLADALVACRLLAKSGGAYENTPETRAFLSGRGPADLRPLLRMAHKVQYRGWIELEEAVRQGGGIRPDVFASSGEEQRIMSEGIEAESGGSAVALAQAYDFAPFRRLLDVGGGTGIHLRVLLEHYPELEGTLFELPAVATMAQARLGPMVESGRARIVQGDAFLHDLPRGRDLLLLSHVVHAFTPERNIELLQRLREHVEPGARLLAIDFWTNDDHTEPVIAALLAGEFFRTIGGDVYSVPEAQDWLDATGWAFRSHQPLNGPTTFVEAEAA